MRQQLDLTMMRIMDLKQAFGIHYQERDRFAAGRSPMTDAQNVPLGDQMITWIKELLVKYTNLEEDDLPHDDEQKMLRLVDMEFCKASI